MSAESGHGRRELDVRFGATYRLRQRLMIDHGIGVVAHGTRVIDHALGRDRSRSVIDNRVIDHGTGVIDHALRSSMNSSPG